MNLVQLQQQRDALIQARLQGVRSYRDQSGEEVTYKSDTEMANALAYAERMIAQINSTNPKTIVFATSKGI
jgi:hypothetical protein